MPDIYIDTKKEQNMPKKEEKVVKTKLDIEHLKGHSHNPLSAFSYYPHNINFINREPDEKVILVVRRHFITNLGWILLVVAMLFAPYILNYFPLLAFLPIKFQLLSILFWYLLTLAIAIQGFMSWFFSVNIITNLRVIDIDFDNLIYRKVTDAKLQNIEDVTVRMSSVIRTIFDYGDVLIQTAAEVPEVEFWAVPHPDKIDEILSDLRLKTKK